MKCINGRSNRIGISAGVNQFTLNTDNFETKPQTGWNAGLSVRGNFYDNWDMVYAIQFSDNNFHGIYNSNNVELAKYILEKRLVNFKSICSIPSNGNFEVLKYLLGDEARDEKGNIVKLPEGIKPITVTSGDWKSIANSHARNIE